MAVCSDQRAPFQRSRNERGAQLQSVATVPTTAQEFAELQDSELKPKPVPFADAVSSGASVAHALPFLRAEDGRASPKHDMVVVQVSVPVSRGASVAHALPFQSAVDRLTSPTHDVADMQETPPGTPESRRVPAIGDQRDPSHASACVPRRTASNLTQNRGETHDRSPEKMSPPESVRIDQVDPFQIAMTRDSLSVAGEEMNPAATQNRDEPHETSENSP